MNISLFIAKRLVLGGHGKSHISAPIIKIAIAAIAIGMVMMLISVATGLGLNYKIREKVAAFNGDLQIISYETNTAHISGSPISKKQSFYPEFKSVTGITHIQGIITTPGIIRTEETFEGIVAKGVSTDYNWTAFKDFLISGRLPNYGDVLNNEVLISDLVAQKLALKTGDTFRTFFIKNDQKSSVPSQRIFKIAGIYDSGFEAFDSSYIFVDLRHLQRISGWEADQISAFEVFVSDFDKIDQKTAEVYAATQSDLDVRSVKERYYNIFDWISLFDFNMILIIGIMILVGGINMVTALLVLILERTPMIGILKALGAADWTVRKVFLYQAIYLIGFGLLVGNTIGLAIIYLQDRFKWLQFPNPKEYYIREIPVFMDVSIVLGLNALVLLLCSLMLLLPSVIVSKVSVVKALKFD
ncbi:MAG: ABC transporter permease [Flavobacteriaceae bacterium]|nr:ABC transporter permease [Flavobacteriaceae bacterium]MBT5921882.1 ABC transporter permease [Flavobacteriaceae bacterium]